MFDSLKVTLAKFATFSGRASRLEWLYWTAAVVAINLVLGLVSGTIPAGGDPNGFAWVQSLFGLIVFLPSLAVAIRRFHDTDKSGFWVLINLIPVVGWIIYLVMMLKQGDTGANKYGPAPTFP